MLRDPATTGVGRMLRDPATTGVGRMLRDPALSASLGRQGGRRTSGLPSGMTIFGHPYRPQ
jgi:hypothetical protein